jgi:hypothetical protein
VAVAITVLAGAGFHWQAWYQSALPYQLPQLAVVLLVSTLLGGLAYAIRWDRRGLWAALILSPAYVLLWSLPRYYPYGEYRPPVVDMAAAGTLLVALAGVLVASRLPRRATPHC